MKLNQNQFIQIIGSNTLWTVRLTDGRTQPYRMSASRKERLHCTNLRILLGWSNQWGKDGEACSLHGRDEKCIQIMFGNLKGREHSEVLVVDRKVILEWTFGKMLGAFGLESSGSGQGPVTGCCEHGNESSGSIKGGISCLADWLLASQEGLYSMESAKNASNTFTRSWAGGRLQLSYMGLYVLMSL
jgi:hypothetical protein